MPLTAGPPHTASITHSEITVIKRPIPTPPGIQKQRLSAQSSYAHAEFFHNRTRKEVLKARVERTLATGAAPILDHAACQRGANDRFCDSDEKRRCHQWPAMFAAGTFQRAFAAVAAERVSG
ncbi:hypothetical protein [Desulfopila aestuarii]|uniref:hypothetical protein n=1 Tax=Desulfopila aestuarii TaxID=231440 RepID=UPI00116111FC|nr:hypothetical protein [Desulfopila aestuarii]